jgi:hypothetical protein
MSACSLFLQGLPKNCCYKVSELDAYLEELVILVVKLGVANMVSSVPVLVNELAVICKVGN